MHMFNNKYSHVRMAMKRWLQQSSKRRNTYGLFCRFFASLGIFVALAVLLTALLSQSEVLRRNQQLRYYITKSASACCYKCALVKSASSADTCRSVMQWPVKPARIVKAYSPPPKPWLAGHRGVDLAATTGTALFAPADGVISFAGKVAGKSVVSIRHGELTSTFEPAVTKLTVGVGVKKGQKFGHVEGGSDHCGKRCVQWGLKKKNRVYVNPAAQTVRRHIVLKPAT